MNRTILAATAAALTALTASCSKSQPTDALTNPSTEEERVVQFIYDFQKAWNSEDFASMAGLTCAAALPRSFMPGANEGITEDQFRQTWKRWGKIAVALRAGFPQGDNSLVVAVEIIDQNRKIHNDEIHLVRENGTWKGCTYSLRAG